MDNMETLNRSDSLHSLRWALAAVDDGNNRSYAAALLPDGQLCEIDALTERSAPIDIVRRWQHFGPILRSWSPKGAVEIVGARLVAPLQYPNKLICVGANYNDHRAEMATSGEGAVVREPFFLMKPPSTAIIGPDAEIPIRGHQDRVDWEAEVGVVIGKRGRLIAREDALDHVAGYLLVNDVSARGAHVRADPMHAAFGYDWVASKGQDGFAPIGPAMLPAWFVDDPDAIPFSLTVNHILEQEGSTANLIADIRRQIVSLSALMTLEEGDIIATGTPGGVGMAKGRFLNHGDIITLSSPLLGSFSNTVRQIDLPARTDGLHIVEMR